MSTALMTSDPTRAHVACDAVVIGATAAGISAAIAALRAGAGHVRILAGAAPVAFPELIGEHRLDIGYGEHVHTVELADDGVVIATARGRYHARACVVAEYGAATNWAPAVAMSGVSRVGIDRIPADATALDVLVVGADDRAVEAVSQLAAIGARVVLAAGGMDATHLAPASVSVLRQLERDRRATVLFRSAPEQISEIAGCPMAHFADRRTPDLQFDHIVFVSPAATASPDMFGISHAAAASGRVLVVGAAAAASSSSIAVPVVPVVPAWSVGHDLLATWFPELEGEPRPSLADQRRSLAPVIELLRDDHYNATITHFEPTHSDLWVLRVRPDHGSVTHLPGQYASLGLGYWEARIDDAEEPDLEQRWDKLVRRSYSISSRMFDDRGYLVGAAETEELEFYVVLVPPSDGNVPGLTPRLALKRPGDRIYLGPKVAGRYTLGPVADPHAAVVFLSTGTGEAPHNAMVVELLRKGHRGPIVSAVSVRQWADLGYMEQHRELEARYPNYRYLPLPTREAGVPKRYLQTLITGGELGEVLDPERTHVFLCGNPAMIGLPEEADGDVRYPEVVGVVELLTSLGFTLERRGQHGNVHVEEYW